MCDCIIHILYLILAYIQHNGDVLFGKKNQTVIVRGLD